tara:strand:+ start:3773 stop:4318 length:546 start_codon:yes stop_codon:yes gene_type:complete
MKKPKNLLIVISSVILIGILYWNFNVQIRGYLLSKHAIFWKKDVELKPSDFKAQIAQNSKSEIWVYFGLYLKSTNLKDAEVKAYFDKNKSWVKDTLNFKDEIEFQKLRFDLYENYARKFNKEIDKIKFDEDKYFSDLEKIGDKIYSELNIMEDSLYNTDLEKNELIKFWRLKIDKMLKTKN